MCFIERKQQQGTILFTTYPNNFTEKQHFNIFKYELVIKKKLLDIKKPIPFIEWAFTFFIFSI